MVEGLFKLSVLDVIVMVVQVVLITIIQGHNFQASLSGEIAIHKPRTVVKLRLLKQLWAISVQGAIFLLLGVQVSVYGTDN